MNTSAKLGIAAAATLSLGVLSTSHEASACGGEMDYAPYVDERPMLVAAAEEQVEVGQEDIAALGVIRSFPGVRDQPLGLSTLSDRAIHAMALAVVRGDGSLPVAAFAAHDDLARGDNLEWAVAILYLETRRQPDNVVFASELAEGMARIPARRFEAYRMLRTLEQRDLLADAHGYATLADLRRRAPEGKPAFASHPLRALEHAGVLLATARCRTRAKEQAICTPDGEQKLASL